MMIRRVMLSLAFRGLSAASSFLVAVVVSRVLGARLAGFYFLAFAILNFLAVIVRIGLDKLVLRQVSIHNSSGNIGKISDLLGLSFFLILAFSLVIGLILWVFSTYIACEVLDKPEMGFALCMAALSIFFAAFTAILSEALQGLSRFSASIFVVNILPNIVILLFLLPSLLNGAMVSLDYSVSSVLFSFVVSCMVGLFFLRDIFSVKTPDVNAAYGAGFLNGWGSLYAIDLMAVNILWASQLLAGHWLLSDDLAHLATAQRTAAIAGLLLIAINTVTAPRYAAMYHQGRHVELKRLAQSSTMAVLFIAVPVAGIMCIFPGVLMSVFGEGFRQGANLLVVLSVGQLVNAATGSVAYLLLMSGHQRDLRNVAFISGFLALVFPLVLLPTMGVMGAALSSSLAMVTQNFLALYMVRRRLGFWTFSLSAGLALIGSWIRLASKLTRK